MCGLCVNLAVMGQSRRGVSAMESTVLAPSGPALPFRFWSIFPRPALERLWGILMREPIGKLWVAKDGRKGERNGPSVGLGSSKFDVCHGGKSVTCNTASFRTKMTIYSLYIFDRYRTSRSARAF